MSALFILFLLLFADSTFASGNQIASISSRTFSDALLYEFEPNTDKISMVFSFDNLRDCIAEFGQSCICYETSLTPFENTMCPPNMASFCFDWNKNLIDGNACPTVKRNAFKATALADDPAKKDQEDEAISNWGTLSICDDTAAEHLHKHYLFWENITLNLDVQQLNVFLGSESFILGAGASHKTSSSGYNMFKFGPVHTTDSCSYKVELSNTNFIPPAPPVPTTPEAPTTSMTTISEGTATPESSGTSTKDSDVDSSTLGTAEAKLGLVWIIFIFVGLFVCGTILYCYLALMAIARRACFKNLDPYPPIIVLPRQAAGADKLLKKRSSGVKKKDPSIEPSIQHKTAAHEYDDFGNLTSEATLKTQPSKDDAAGQQKAKKSQSKEVLGLKVGSKKPDAPPTTAETIKSVTGKSTKNETTKEKSKEVLPEEKQPLLPLLSEQAVDVATKPQTTSGISNENPKPEPAKPTMPPAVPPTSTAIDSEAPSNIKSDQPEPTFWEMVRYGTLKYERPGLYRVLIILTTVYGIFVVACIGFAILTAFLV